MLRAVIFDFDGVISDSECLHLKAFNEVLARFDIQISEQDYYKEYLGFTDLDCFTIIAEQHNLGLDDAAIKSLIEQKQEVFEELIKKGNTIIQGVPEFLRMLRENNVPVAICSGALRADIEIALVGTDLSDFFEVIVAADDVENGKPDPEGFLVALKELNKKQQDEICPDECVAIEDSHWGLEAAQKAGMHTIAVTNSYKAEQLKTAEKIVARLDALLLSDLNDLCL